MLGNKWKVPAPRTQTSATHSCISSSSLWQLMDRCGPNKTDSGISFNPRGKNLASIPEPISEPGNASSLPSTF